MYEIVYDGVDENKEYDEVIKKVLSQCFNEENLENSNLWITVTLTTPRKIQEIKTKEREQKIF